MSHPDFSIKKHMSFGRAHVLFGDDFCCWHIYSTEQTVCSYSKVATRLFDYTEKIKAENVEKAALSGLIRAMQEKGIERSTSKAITFVPFRDTAQDKMKAVNKTKTIGAKKDS